MAKEIVCFRVSKELRDALIKEAKDRGLTLSEYCYVKMGIKEPIKKISFWQKIKRLLNKESPANQ